MTRVVDHYSFEDLVTLRITRRRRLPVVDQFLDTTFAFYRVDDLPGQPDIDVTLGPVKPRPRGCSVIDGRYHVDDRSITFETEMKLARWRTRIEGLDGGPLSVRIDANLPARMVFPGETLYSLIRLHLLEKGMVLLHAPGVVHNGRALVLPARGGTGKTITAVNFARSGWGFMGDDSSILSAAGIASFIVPFNLRFTYDVESLLGIRFSRAKRAEILGKKLLSMATLGRINLFSRIYPWDIFSDTLVHRAPLGAVYLLVQGPEAGISPLQPTDTFARQVLINTLFEADELRCLLLAWCYRNPSSPLVDAWTRCRALLEERLDGVTCRIVTVPAVYTPEVFESIRRQAELDLGGPNT